VISADPACAGTKTYTYTFTACDNQTYDWVYTCTISAPTVTMPADDGTTVACAADAVAPTVPPVVDNCGRTLAVPTPVISADPACAGTKTYTYTFTACDKERKNTGLTYSNVTITVAISSVDGTTVS